MATITYRGHKVSLEGIKDGYLVFYIDTTIVTVPNFAAFDKYITNLEQEI